MTIIFFTTGSASTSGVPFRTGGRGVTSFVPDELADDAVTGDFSGDVPTEEAADFTGDATGEATCKATGDVTCEALFGGSVAGKSAANGEPAGAIMVSGEATALGEGVLVLFDCSTTTGLDTTGGAFGWETSAFEATVSVIVWFEEGFGGMVLGGGEASETFEGTIWEASTTLAGTSGSFCICCPGGSF